MDDIYEANRNMKKEIDRLQTEYSDALRTISDMQSKWEAEHTDAERYRWLREQGYATSSGFYQLSFYWSHDEPSFEQALDAAMKEG